MISAKGCCNIKCEDGGKVTRTTQEMSKIINANHKLAKMLIKRLPSLSRFIKFIEIPKMII